MLLYWYRKEQPGAIAGAGIEAHEPVDQLCPRL